MKPTIGTRFGSRRPLTDLTQLTIMFDTLGLQYLNKLVEGEVGDFASPQAFHTVKVQGFNGDTIKGITKIRSQFPMKVFTLVANPSIEVCDLSNSTPPAVRTFFFTTQCFVEITKFRQGLLQRLRVLYFSPVLRVK